jgi:hypothetical protein
MITPASILAGGLVPITIAAAPLAHYQCRLERQQQQQQQQQALLGDARRLSWDATCNSFYLRAVKPQDVGILGVSAVVVSVGSVCWWDCGLFLARMWTVSNGEGMHSSRSDSSVNRCRSP